MRGRIERIWGGMSLFIVQHRTLRDKMNKFLKRNAMENRQNIFQVWSYGEKFGGSKGWVYQLLVNIFSFFSFFFFTSKKNMEGNFNFLCVRRSEKGNDGMSERARITFSASLFKRFFFVIKQKSCWTTKTPSYHILQMADLEISFPWYRSRVLQASFLLLWPLKFIPIKPFHDCERSKLPSKFYV